LGHWTKPDADFADTLFGFDNEFGSRDCAGDAGCFIRGKSEVSEGLSHQRVSGPFVWEEDQRSHLVEQYVADGRLGDFDDALCGKDAGTI